MLSPKRMKFRKAHKGRLRGRSKGGDYVAFGEYGLVALQTGKITSRQIEAARVALSRHTKRGGQIWIKIFPHKPVTRKPLETRMGSGKGGVEYYVAAIKPGRVLYEIGGVPRDVAFEALELAGSKLPIKTKVLSKHEDPWNADQL